MLEIQEKRHLFGPYSSKHPHLRLLINYLKEQRNRVCS